MPCFILSNRAAAYPLRMRVYDVLACLHANQLHGSRAPQVQFDGGAMDGIGDNYRGMHRLAGRE